MLQMVKLFSQIPKYAIIFTMFYFTALSQYVGAMRDVALVRLVRQVAQCYQSIRFTRLIELAVFTDRFHLERLLVDCVRHNDMQIRIDHANK